MSRLLAGLFAVTVALVLVPDRSAAAPTSDAPGSTMERRVWRGEPLAVALPLESERTISFPGATTVRAGLVGGPVPGLRIQSLGERLFVLATGPVATTRLLVQTDTGGSYLLDLSTAEGEGSATPLEIHAALDDPATSGESASPEASSAGSVGYVALVRHAARSLYAPPRLIPPSDAIFRVPLRGAGRAVALLRAGRVGAEALVAWRGEGARGPLWVTAVRLRNNTATPLDLDPRDLRGQWLAAAFQHGHLGAAGQETDTTTAYLVSATPFDEALGAFFEPAGAP